MLTIRTVKDIETIRDRRMLHPILTDELERYFRETVESLTGDKEAWIDYDLTEDGPFLVLQPEFDNIDNLGDYGLTQEYGGLLSATPEFASIVRLEGMELYRIVLVLDNSFCLVVFAEKDKFSEDFEEWVQEYLME